jgi:hypothetical protein
MTTSSTTKGLIAFSLLFLTTACSSETKTTEESEPAKTEETTTSAEANTEETTPEEEVAPPKSVKLSGKFLNEDEFGGSHYQVILTVDGKKEIIDTVMACDKIPASNFAQYDIPKTALSACGGWWAGAGDYFYAELKDNKVVVYQGWQDEQQTDDGYHWEVVKR